MNPRDLSTALGRFAAHQRRPAGEMFAFDSRTLGARYTLEPAEYLDGYIDERDRLIGVIDVTASSVLR